MALSAADKKAMSSGRGIANRLLSERASALQARAEVLETLAIPEQISLEAAAVPGRLLRAAGGMRSAGILVAEGDSWFDYPWTDVLGVLEDDFGYDVEDVAHKGDRLEGMA